MSEVTTWNATDNANTAAPPDGWPEGQQPSSVNDCGRMMMGALRREHDRITAQIGSVAGTINTTNITAVTVNTTGAITASGAITGAAINSTGNGSIAGTLTAGGVSTGNLNASGTVTAAQLTSTGNIIASGNINTGVSGGVYAGYVSSNGNIDAGGQIHGNTMVANGISSNGNMQAAGQFSCGPFYTAGTYGIGNWKFTVTDEIYCNRHIYPGGYGFVGCGGSALPWAWVESIVYYTASDPAVKRDIEPVPVGCLDLVNAIEPKTYKFNLEPSDAVDQRERDRTHWGFLAPEVGEAMQARGFKFDGVRRDGDEPSSLAYNEMIAILWSAVRDLSQQVTELKREKADV